MATAKDRVNEVMDSTGMSSDVESIKSSFADLRRDVGELLSSAFGLGKTGANAAKDGASDAFDSLKERFADLKDRGADKMSGLEKKIEDNPIAAALIALGVGYVIAKFLTRK